MRTCDARTVCITVSPSWHIPNTFQQYSEPPPAPVIIDREPEYEISKIVDSKIDCRRACKLLYKVIWLGYEDTDNDSEWLPAAELEHAKELVNNFHLKYPTKPGPLQPWYHHFTSSTPFPSKLLQFKKKNLSLSTCIHSRVQFPLRWIAYLYSTPQFLLPSGTCIQKQSPLQNLGTCISLQFPLRSSITCILFHHCYYSHPFSTHRKKTNEFKKLIKQNYKFLVPWQIRGRNRSGVGQSRVELLWNGWGLTTKWGTTLASARALCLNLLSRVWLRISGGLNCCQKFRRGMV